MLYDTYLFLYNHFILYFYYFHTLSTLLFRLQYPCLFKKFYLLFVTWFLILLKLHLFSFHRSSIFWHYIFISLYIYLFFFVFNTRFLFKIFSTEHSFFLKKKYFFFHTTTKCYQIYNVIYKTLYFLKFLNVTFLS